MIEIELKENACYLVPKVLKEKLNNQIALKHLANVKVCTFEDIENYLSFSYTKDACHFLTTTCHVSLPVANMYMESIHDILDKKYEEEALDKLVVYYHILKEYKKLTFSSYGKSFLSRFPIYIVGFDYFTKKQHYFIDQLKEITTVQFIKIRAIETKKRVVYAFEHIKEEVEYLAYTVAKKIEEGIPLDHIYFIGLTDEYRPFINRIFSYYHIPFKMQENLFLIETNVGKTFLKLVKEKEREEIFDVLKEQYHHTKEEKKLVSTCIDILNRYAWYDGKIKDLYEEILEDTKKEPVSLENGKSKIKETSLLHNYFDENDYVFIVGANQGSFPTLKKDEDYITDKLAPFTLKEDSVTENRNRKQGTSQALLRIPNLYISYKEKTDAMIYYPSSLLQELHFDVEKKTLDLHINYGGNYNKIRLGILLDELKNYNSYQEELTLLSSAYGTQGYLSYEHQFKPIKDTFTPRLSYTSMSTYFECGFKYYLNYILSLNEFEESFAQKVGNIYHAVLEANKEEEELVNQLNELEKEASFDAKEQVWWENLRSHLFSLLEVVKNQKMCTEFKEELHEKEVYASVTSRDDITLKGIIDKVLMYQKDGKTYAALVDYKTGSPSISLKNLKYGFDMQLPFYLYLLHQTKEIDVDQVVGFYLQKCLNYNLHTKHHEKIEDNIKDSLRLEGYSISDENVLSKLDKTYQNSEWIKGLKTTKNGFSSYAKLVTYHQIEDIVNLMEKNIITAYDHITKGEFPIQPKVLDGVNRSCTFCPFKDICFKISNDTVYLGDDDTIM